MGTSSQGDNTLKMGHKNILMANTKPHPRDTFDR